ncbi:MAG: hypothetical protein SFX18_00015 [Pirellulales bacterium]|nr:hypothetical protein [Pirellulales bacterium]
MAIDPYATCPGGTGKKIKFCCQDLQNELGKLEQQISGQQLSAALDATRHLCEKYPQRACLLSYECLLELLTRDHEGFAKTAEQFIALQPQNPVALAYRAILAAQTGDLLETQNALQDALENSGPEVHARVYTALQIASEILLGFGQVIPARAYLTLMSILTKGQDENCAQRIMRLEQEQRISVLLKDMPSFRDAPRDAPYRQEFDAAMRNAGRGAWRLAAKQLQTLANKYAEEPAIGKNLAILHGFLGNYPEARAAWRAYADLDISEEEEIEAEAMAQIMIRDEAEGEVRDLLVTIPVLDFDGLESGLAGTRLAEKRPFDTLQFTQQNQVPPRAVYALFDRPRPESSNQIAREQIPMIVANAFLFGKETDQPARLEIEVLETHKDQVLSMLRSVAGANLGHELKEEQTGAASALELALSWQWRLPDKTGWRERVRLTTEQREHVLLEVWPKLKLPLLDNLTPNEAAADWNLRDRLQAAIMLLETTDSSDAAPATFAKLRQHLGLPHPQPIPPAEFDFTGERLFRYLYLDVEQLSPEQLQQSLERTLIAQFMPAAKRLALEAIRRQNIDPPELQLAAYQVMVRVSEDLDQALIYIDTGRKLAEKFKFSTAPWDLEELRIRLVRLEGAEVAQLIQHLSAAHSQEPGVGEQMYQLLASAGLIGPDGQLVGLPPPTGSSSVIVGADTGPGEGKLWTPESAAKSEGKSALWIPE